MFNEMYQSESVIRNHYNNINDWLDQMTSKVILEKNAEAETHFRNIGITFSTNNETARERIIPFDLIPRIFRIIKIDIVNPEYNKRILIDCFKISAELKDKKLVKDFFKLSS